jgi:hypothetical protein
VRGLERGDVNESLLDVAIGGRPVGLETGLPDATLARLLDEP